MSEETLFNIFIVVYPIMGLLIFFLIDGVNGNMITLARKIKLSVFWPITLFIGDEF